MFKSAIRVNEPKNHHKKGINSMSGMPTYLVRIYVEFPEHYDRELFGEHFQYYLDMDITV